MVVMMSKETEARVARVIMTIAQEEKAIEVVRQVLAEQSQFEPYAAFQRLDRQYHGYITSSDLKRYLKYTEGWM